jgi:hypothetical protein
MIHDGINFCHVIALIFKQRLRSLPLWLISRISMMFIQQYEKATISLFGGQCLVSSTRQWQAKS